MAAKRPTSKRGSLSREVILRAALAVVDREGLEAISMRRLGDELGVEAMSLYNHIENKAAILDGIFEIVLAELAPPKHGGSWQSVVRDRARALRTVLSAHPNALPIFATRPATTPGSIAHIEPFLDVLRKAGFSPRSTLNTLQVMVAFVVGHTTASFSPRKVDETSLPAYERLSEATFPRVREMARLLDSHSPEDEFEFGLDVLVAGLDKKAASKAAR